MKIYKLLYTLCIAIVFKTFQTHSETTFKYHEANSSQINMAGRDRGRRGGRDLVPDHQAAGRQNLGGHGDGGRSSSEYHYLSMMISH